MEQIIFKIKGKFKPLNNEVLVIINIYAKRLALYEERLPEESQSNGYHCFKKFCLNDVVLTSGSKFSYFNMGAFHYNIRNTVIIAVKKVRESIKELKN